MSAPCLVAALVLCAAAAAKLRAPGPAARALLAAGLPASGCLVRAFAAGELALGSWSLIAPGRLTAAALSAVYLSFAGLALLLARRAAACGCFGSADVPASSVQSALSAVIGALSAAAAVRSAHGVGWVFDRPVGPAAVLALGLAGATYATVLAYTELPAALGAWGRP